MCLYDAGMCIESDGIRWYFVNENCFLKICLQFSTIYLINVYGGGLLALCSANRSNVPLVISSEDIMLTIVFCKDTCIFS